MKGYSGNTGKSRTSFRDIPVSSNDLRPFQSIIPDFQERLSDFQKSKTKSDFCCQQGIFKFRTGFFVGDHQLPPYVGHADLVSVVRSSYVSRSILECQSAIWQAIWATILARLTCRLTWAKRPSEPTDTACNPRYAVESAHGPEPTDTMVQTTYRRLTWAE